MPFDTMLFDVGDVVNYPEYPETLRVASYGPNTRDGLYLRDPGENVLWLGQEHNPPILVVPAKWRIGDKIEYSGVIKEARGIYTVAGVTPSGQAATEEKRFTLPGPYNGMEVYGIRLVHRPGVTVLYQSAAPTTTPCPDCSNTDHPGEYVGFTSRGPCPTCHGRCHV